MTEEQRRPQVDIGNRDRVHKVNLGKLLTSLYVTDPNTHTVATPHLSHHSETEFNLPGRAVKRNGFSPTPYLSLQNYQSTECSGLC